MVFHSCSRFKYRPALRALQPCFFHKHRKKQQSRILQRCRKEQPMYRSSGGRSAQRSLLSLSKRYSCRTKSLNRKNCTDNQQNPVPCLGSAVLHRGWLYNFTTAESGKYGSIKQNQRETDHEDQKTDHAEAVEHRFNGPDLIAGRQGLWSAERCIKKSTA